MRILICDDSSIARKSLGNCIDTTQNVSILYANDGAQALEILSQQHVDVLFLDITMPVMDGFEVLLALQPVPDSLQVVMVSADIQDKAKQRCFELGAKAFIEKPLHPNSAIPLFHELGIEFCPSRLKQASLTRVQSIECFREIANIALGSGAATIADHLQEFIQLPVPVVGEITFGEVTMTIQDSLARQNTCAVSQRFVGGGLHGEALVCVRSDCVALVGQRLGFDTTDSSQDEIIVNIVNLLVSSFLTSLSNQLGIEFSLRQPLRVEEFFPKKSEMKDTEQIFVIEYTYEAESMDLGCEILLLLDAPSVEVICQLMEGSY